jgi:hypothetical protein
VGRGWDKGAKHFEFEEVLIVVFIDMSLVIRLEVVASAFV